LFSFIVNIFNYPECPLESRGVTRSAKASGSTRQQSRLKKGGEFRKSSDYEEIIGSRALGTFWSPPPNPPSRYVYILEESECQPHCLANIINDSNLLFVARRPSNNHAISVRKSENFSSHTNLQSFCFSGTRFVLFTQETSV
jgi:hypothetical protein